MNRWATLSHILMVGSLLGLALLLGSWLTVISPPANTGLIAPLLLVLVLPLVIPLRGLLHGKRYTAAWVSLMSLFYFAYGIAHIPDAAPIRYLGIACTVLSLVLFLGTVGYVRLTREPKATTPRSE